MKRLGIRFLFARCSRESKSKHAAGHAGAVRVRCGRRRDPSVGQGDTGTGAKACFGGCARRVHTMSGFKFVVNSVIAILICGLAATARGETSSQADGMVSGSIVDESAAVIPGATVNLLRQNSATQSTTSQADGTFSFDGVTPGTYTLRAEIAGFETYQETIVVGPEPVARLKITLRVRGLETDVTVEADELADAFSTSVSNGATLRMGDDFRRALPIVADDFLGVVGNFFYPGAQGSQGASVIVDGVQGDQIDVPSSALGTVRLNRNPYSALYQHPGQARLEVSTKRGRRSRYDAGFEMSERNTLFAARNAFAPATQELGRRLLQPTLAGPLPGKKSSFYFTGQRFVHDESAVVNAETLTGPVVANVPTSHDHNSIFARIQAWPNSLQTITGTYGFSGHEYSNQDAGGFNLRERGIATKKDKHTLTLSHRLLRASNWQNDFLFGFVDQQDHAGSAATAPAIDVNDAFSSGPSPRFDRANRRSFSLENTVRYLGRAGHSLVFGGRFRSDHVDAFDASNFAGTYEFADLEAFHDRTPLFFRINRGDPNAAFSVYEANGYVQDEIRVRSQLTLTFGVRYDWQSTTSDRNNVAPRFAFAFAPENHKKTIFRGGAGIFSDQLGRSAIEQSQLRDGIRLHEVVISGPSFPNPFSSGADVSQLPSTVRVAPGIRSPSLSEASFSVERELRQRNTLTAEYSWFRGTDLFRSRNINAPLPGTDLRPDPNFLNINQVESSAFLHSQALTVSWRGRLGKVFQPYAQYVFSKTTTNTSGTFSVPANNYDLRAETGPADDDARHRFNMMGVVALPRGFQTGLVLSVRSGLPYDITTGLDDNNDTVANDRPVGITRNTGRGPATAQLDLRISKSFAIVRVQDGGQQQRRDTVDLIVDLFNATNRTNYKSIVGDMSSQFFGRANVAAAARTVQFSARYTFRR